jgi:ribose 1,5-bisphosphokinase PhnN
MAYHSIRVSMETLVLLADLKIHPRESYNDVVARLIRRAKAGHPLVADPEQVAALERAVGDLRADYPSSF